MLAERIVGIQNGDYERLSICVMENIRYVLDFQHELSLDNQLVRIALPRFDRIVTKETRIEMDELFRIGHPTRVRTDPCHQHSALIPRNHIPNDVIGEIGGNNILRHVDDAGIVGGDDESTSNVASNRYVTNNATLQAVHEDLSEKSSVEAIINYMVRSNKSQLEKWDEVKDEYPNTAEPPLAQVMIGCGCDGQPAVAMRRILAEDARCNRSERLYPDTIFVSFGGFHTIMKGLNASGAKDFDKIIFTKARLWELCNIMTLEEKSKNENHRVDISDPLPKIGASKPNIVGYLLKWRRQVFKKNPTLEHQLTERVKSDFADKGLSTQEQRAELIEDELFRLTDSARQMERYREVIRK